MSLRKEGEDMLFPKILIVGLFLIMNGFLTEGSLKSRLTSVVKRLKILHSGERVDSSDHSNNLHDTRLETESSKFVQDN